MRGEWKAPVRQIGVECEGCGQSFAGRSIKDVSRQLRDHMGASFPSCPRPVQRRLPLTELSWKARKVAAYLEGRVGVPTMGQQVARDVRMSKHAVHDAARELVMAGYQIVRRDLGVRGVAYTLKQGGTPPP